MYGVRGTATSESNDSAGKQIAVGACVDDGVSDCSEAGSGDRAGAGAGAGAVAGAGAGAGAGEAGLAAGGVRAASEAGIAAGAIYAERVDEGVVGRGGWYGVVTTGGG